MNLKDQQSNDAVFEVEPSAAQGQQQSASHSAVSNSQHQKIPNQEDIVNLLIS
jgi:hypothetical protein